MELKTGIVGVSENFSNVWNIPFPAITICPETKALRSFVNITDGFHVTKNGTPPFNLSDEMLSFFGILIFQKLF